MNKPVLYSGRTKPLPDTENPQHRTSRDGNESKENPVFNNVSIDTGGVFGSAMWSLEAPFQQHHDALEKSSGNHGEAFPHSPHA